MTSSAINDDGTIMLQLKNGDDMALNILMDKWQTPLIHFLIRYTGNHHDAVDLAQETFVRVYRSRSLYQAKGSFSTWLFTIATRLARNRARWKNRHPEVSIDAGIGGDSSEKNGAMIDRIKSSGTNPSEEMARDERFEEIRTAIQQLPLDLRESLLLFAYQDMSYAEIAEVVDCSVKAVENRIYRARKRLESYLFKV